MFGRHDRIVAPARLHESNDLCRFRVECGVGLSCRLVLGKMPVPRGLTVDPAAEVALVVPHRRLGVEGSRAVDVLTQMNDPLRVGTQQGANIDRWFIPDQGHGGHIHFVGDTIPDRAVGMPLAR